MPAQKSLPPLDLHLQDDQWPLEYIDHHRQIARAVVVDEDGFFYFVRASRDDDFGKASYMETSGGGVEPGEALEDAVRRELREELGIECAILSKIGVVQDYYNLIHRHNINHYFLCRLLSFGSKHLTADEADLYHLTTAKLRYEEAAAEYQRYMADNPIGLLIGRRELPVLKRAKELLDAMEQSSV